jgi:hypothetical protein
MAITPTQSALAATINGRGKEIFDQTVYTYPMFVKARESGGGIVKSWETAGENIEFVIKTQANNTFRSVDYKDKSQFTEQDLIRTIQMPRKFLRGEMMLYEAQQEANQGKTKIVDLAELWRKDAIEAGQDLLARELEEDGTGTHLTGIPAILSATNEYLTINRATAGNEWWKAKTGAQFTVTYNGGRTRTFGPYNTAEKLVVDGGTDGGIARLYDDLCDNGGKNGPDFARTTRDLYYKLKADLDARKMLYIDQKMVDLGFPENIQYRGMTIFWDNECTAGEFEMWKTRYLQIKPYYGYDMGFKATNWLDLRPQGIMADAMIFQWSGEIAHVMPGRCGKLTGKTA